MWRRSASFILERRQNDSVSTDQQQQQQNLTDYHTNNNNTNSLLMENPNSTNKTPLSAYYQTRAAHHGVVTSDWLSQAQAAVGHLDDDDDDDDSPPPTTTSVVSSCFNVIDEFNSWRKQPDLAEAVAAIRALAAVIGNSQATTMMELEIELTKASDSLKSWDTTSISLTAGCDLFMRYMTRTSALEYEDFNSAKSRLIERAEKFGEISYKARRIIAMLSQDFIFDGCTILVHGFSRVVLEVLKTAAQSKKLFRVLCTEGRPDRTGLRLSNELAKLDFARLYPLDQKDMGPALRKIDFGVPIPSKVEVEKSARDYTPPQYLTLLFTDLGVLTPSVVSDELIQLYLDRKTSQLGYITLNTSYGAEMAILMGQYKRSSVSIIHVEDYQVPLVLPVHITDMNQLSKKKTHVNDMNQAMALSIVSVSPLAVEKLSDISPSFFWNVREVMSLSITGVEAILSCDDLQIASEAVVYVFVLKWVRAQNLRSDERHDILSLRLAQFIASH
ncbi:hypothetical protein ACFE04_012177 [Oxalis oulophora]